jgi:hypothetical protein
VPLDIPGRNFTRTKSCWTERQELIKLASAVGPRELNEADGQAIVENRSLFQTSPV